MKTIHAALPLALAVWAACSPAPPTEAPPPSQPAPPPATATPPSAEPTAPVTPPAGRPTSLDDLVGRAMTAIKAGDAGAYNQLMFTLDDVKQHCPKALKDVNEEMITRMHGSVAKSVTECGQIDWAKAKPIEQTGGARKGQEKQCNAGVVELEDVRIVFEVAGKKVHVKLDDPMIFPDGTHAFSDDPSCGDGTGDLIVPPPPLPPGDDLPETPVPTTPQ